MLTIKDSPGVNPVVFEDFIAYVPQFVTIPHIHVGIVVDDVFVLETEACRVATAPPAEHSQLV
jgi:hypothetical protein